MQGATISDIDADTSANDLKALIDTTFELSEVKVTKDEDCYGSEYHLEWTQTSGDVEAVTVSIRSEDPSCNSIMSELKKVSVWAGG